MNYDDSLSKSSIIKKRDDYKYCYFSEKKWVNPKNINDSSYKEHEKGDFLRVWCQHNQCWCSAEFGYESCII